MLTDDIRALDAAVAYMETKGGNPDVIANLKQQADHLRFRSVPSARNMNEQQIREAVAEVFRDFWLPIVEVKDFDPEGHDTLVHRSSGIGLSMNQIMLELWDYHNLMESASRAYSELTWVLSKPNTDPAYIIEYAEGRIGKYKAEDIIEVIEAYAAGLVEDETDESIGVLKLQAAAITAVADMLRDEFDIAKETVDGEIVEEST